MPYQNEMSEIQKQMEKVQDYSTWMPERQPSFSAAPSAKVAQDSLKSHKNSHDK